MSEFEKWVFNNLRTDSHSFNRDVELAKSAWQAATAVSDKRIAELTATIESQASEIAELNEQIIEMTAYEASMQRIANEDAKQIIELQSSVNVLREALEDCRLHPATFNIANKALASTPSQYINNDVQIFDKKSLARHDDEVIERCANVVEEVSNNAYCVLAVDKIRALKSKS